MISIDDACRRIADHSAALLAARVSIQDALGLVLATRVTSDVDSPPDDKAMMDGYAVDAGSDVAPGVVLRVVEEVTAGQVPRRPVTPGSATRIMTGAPIPEGASAVVPVEETEPAGDSLVRLLATEVARGQHILVRGTSFSQGDELLRAGHEIRPVEIGLLAEMGHAQVHAYPRPRVAVIATGNELVPAGEVPARGQLRNSNGPMLAAASVRAGAAATDLGIAADQPRALAEAIERGLAFDILILSGGVSAGVLDLVPETLRRLGVDEVFHKVRMKPGKPVWFGVRPVGGDDRRTLVFGLPGNPVSSLVCFELLVRAAIARLQGRSDWQPKLIDATITQPYRFQGARMTFVPADLTLLAAGWTVVPVPWQGSADLASLKSANALIQFSPPDRDYCAHEPVRVYPLFR